MSVTMSKGQGNVFAGRRKCKKVEVGKGGRWKEGNKWCT